MRIKTTRKSFLKPKYAVDDYIFKRKLPIKFLNQFDWYGLMPLIMEDSECTYNDIDDFYKELINDPNIDHAHIKRLLIISTNIKNMFGEIIKTAFKTLNKNIQIYKHVVNEILYLDYEIKPPTIFNKILDYLWIEFGALEYLMCASNSNLSYIHAIKNKCPQIYQDVIKMAIMCGNIKLSTIDMKSRTIYMWGIRGFGKKYTLDPIPTIITNDYHLSDILWICNYTVIKDVLVYIRNNFTTTYQQFVKIYSGMELQTLDRNKMLDDREKEKIKKYMNVIYNEHIGAMKICNYKL